VQEVPDGVEDGVAVGCVVGDAVGVMIGGSVGGRVLIITVGAIVGGGLVGRAVTVWAACVKARPGSGVALLTPGRLQAVNKMIKNAKMDKVRSDGGFIYFSLIIAVLE
jgi:hypothetical protein